MSTRDDIVAAVHAGLGGRRVDADLVRREAASLLDNLGSTRPTLKPVALADAFAERVTPRRLRRRRSIASQAWPTYRLRSGAILRGGGYGIGGARAAVFARRRRCRLMVRVTELALWGRSD